MSTLHPSITPLSKTGKANFMLFGPPGVGKTRTIGEASVPTLLVRPPTDHVDSIRVPKHVKEWVVDKWSEMEEVEEFCRHNPTAFEWVWLDSISLFQKHGLEDVFEWMNANKPHRKNGPIDKGEYGNNMDRILKWVRHMVGIPGFNFGITAHPAEMEDNVGNVKLRPYIQGKDMSFNVCGMMNIVGYMEVVTQDGKQRRVIRFSETEQYTAKDQFDMFPKHRLVDPTMDKIIAALPQRSAAPRQRPRRRAVKVRSK